MRKFVLVLALVVGCGSSGGSGDEGSNGGVPNDGDCPEKDEMLATQNLAEDPNGPGGATITDQELRDIQAAIANVPSDC